MNIINFASIKQKIVRFIIVQLFLTLISLPILVAWGLPLSILSPIGNLIFAPLLTLFLLFSSLVFFCELIYLPNAWLVWPLELITSAWHKLLCLEQGTSLCAFTKPSPWILCIIPAAALAATSLKIMYHPARSMLILSILFVTSIIILKAHPPSVSFKRDIPCNNGNLTLIHAKGIPTCPWSVGLGLRWKSRASRGWSNPGRQSADGATRILHLRRRRYFNCPTHCPACNRPVLAIDTYTGLGVSPDEAAFPNTRRPLSHLESNEQREMQT